LFDNPCVNLPKEHPPAQPKLMIYQFCRHSLSQLSSLPKLSISLSKTKATLEWHARVSCDSLSGPKAMERMNILTIEK
jgi:hypothetical protein